MMSHDLRRYTDFSDVPRPLAWFIIAVREIGITAVTIGALLYICFNLNNRVVDSYREINARMVALDKNDDQLLKNDEKLMRGLEKISESLLRR